MQAPIDAGLNPAESQKVVDAYVTALNLFADTGKGRSPGERLKLLQRFAKQAKGPGRITFPMSDAGKSTLEPSSSGFILTGDGRESITFHFDAKGNLLDHSRKKIFPNFGEDPALPKIDDTFALKLADGILTAIERRDLKRAILPKRRDR